jgi:hypothetical protein
MRTARLTLSAVLGLVLILMSTAPAKADYVAPVADAARRAGLLVGWGTSVAGFGAGAEAYVAGSRVSLFGALGYVPWPGGSSLAAAGGARVFTGGRRHRGFAEVSVSPGRVETTARAGGTTDAQVVYGPGLILGYQFVGSSGVTFVVSAGVAYGLTGPLPHKVWVPNTIAVGYTWRGKQLPAAGRL